MGVGLGEIPDGHTENLDSLKKMAIGFHNETKWEEGLDRMTGLDMNVAGTYT